jgi:hypothetical protein
LGLNWIVLFLWEFLGVGIGMDALEGRKGWIESVRLYYHAEMSTVRLVLGYEMKQTSVWKKGKKMRGIAP